MAQVAPQALLRMRMTSPSLSRSPCAASRVRGRSLRHTTPDLQVPTGPRRTKNPVPWQRQRPGEMCKRVPGSDWDSASACGWPWSGRGTEPGGDEGVETLDGLVYTPVDPAFLWVVGLLRLLLSVSKRISPLHLLFESVKYSGSVSQVRAW